MTDVTTKGLIVVPAGDGEPHWIGSSRITVKATAAQTNGGYGLRGMRARVGEVGGCCTVHSAPGEGTTVNVAVPS